MRETLQWITIKRRAPNIPYLENVGPSKLELQKKALEKVVHRKAAREAAKARGECTSSQGGVFPSRGTMISTRTPITRTEAWPT